MAETILNAGLAKTVWRKNYFRGYVRASRFAPYMGRGLDNIIVTMYELQNEAGKTIIVPFIGKLTGSGVSGSQVLEGNEEDLGSGNMPVIIDWRRNAVVVPKSEQFKTDIDLLDAAKPALRDWESELLRRDILRQLGAISINDTGLTTVNYADASEAQKDTWLTLNVDRILFGKDIANSSSLDHSTSLANIDTTNDKATAALITKMKRMAKAAKITPYKVEDDEGREWFVLFAGPRAFRDLELDATILAADTNARKRGIDNHPIFQGGDLLFKGIIIREEPEITALVGVGAGPSDVEPMYMCGAGAIAIAWGQMPQSKTRLVDYDFRKGVGIEELLGVKKIHEAGVQRSVVTGYVSATADG